MTSWDTPGETLPTSVTQICSTILIFILFYRPIYPPFIANHTQIQRILAIYFTPSHACNSTVNLIRRSEKHYSDCCCLVWSLLWLARHLPRSGLKTYREPGNYLARFLFNYYCVHVPGKWPFQHVASIGLDSTNSPIWSHLKSHRVHWIWLCCFLCGWMMQLDRIL